MKIKFYNWWKEDLFLLPGIHIDFELKELTLSWLWFGITLDFCEM